MKGGSKRARMRTIYTKGQINRLIDGVCHLLSKANPGMLMLDGFLHGMVEMNPPLSFRKFLKHNVPMLIEEVGRTYGAESYGTAREFSKAFRLSTKLIENLKRRKRAISKP